MLAQGRSLTQLLSLKSFLQRGARVLWPPNSARFKLYTRAIWVWRHPELSATRELGHRQPPLPAATASRLRYSHLIPAACSRRLLYFSFDRHGQHVQGGGDRIKHPEKGAGPSTAA